MQRLKWAFVTLGVAALIAAPASGASPDTAAMKKLAGAWMLQTFVPANPFIEGGEPFVFPELVTITTDGSVMSTTALALFEIEGEAVLSLTGHANCKKIGKKRFATTQWRFMTAVETGDFVGFMRVTTDFRLANRNEASGRYRVELLQPDLTPFQEEGVDVVIEGTFVMTRLPVERLR